MADDKKNVIFKIVVAWIISTIGTSVIAFFFLSLSDSASGFIESAKAQEIAAELDGTVWKTNAAGRKLLLSLYSAESDGILQIKRYGDDSMLLILSDSVTIAGPEGDTVGGVLGGIPFRISITESKSGEGRAFSIVSDDTSVVFSQ